MLDALLTPQMAAAFVLAIAGGMIRGYTGFGTPMFLAPIYAVLFGPAETVPLMIMIEIGIMVQMLPGALPKADWPELRGLLIGCLPMLAAGGMALSVLDPVLVKKLIGLMTASFVVLLWFGWRYRGPRTWPVRILVGAASGFANGLTGVGGPPAILYYLSGEKEIGTIRANLIIYFASITAVAVPLFIYKGYVTWETMARWAVLTPPLLVGVRIGAGFFHGTTTRVFLRWALATLLVSALVGIFG